jgi:hypothetical protein
MHSPTDNFMAKLDMIRQRLDRVRRRQTEHFRQFRRLKKWNLYFKALINVLNTISVTSLVLTFSGSHWTLLVCTVTNSLSAVGTAILTVANLDYKYQSHQTSYLQFAELHNNYTAELLHDNLNGHDMDRILADINSKFGLILDNCEPIELSSQIMSTRHVTKYCQSNDNKAGKQTCVDGPHYNHAVTGGSSPSQQSGNGNMSKIYLSTKISPPSSEIQLSTFQKKESIVDVKQKDAIILQCKTNDEEQPLVYIDNMDTYPIHIR